MQLRPSCSATHRLPLPRRPWRESANRHAGRARIRGMNVRPVPARGGVAGKDSVIQREKYIPEDKYPEKTKDWAASWIPAGRRSYSSVPLALQFQPLSWVAGIGILNPQSGSAE